MQEKNRKGTRGLTACAWGGAEIRAELRVRDGRLEPLLNLPKQEVAVRKYIKAVQTKVKWGPAATDSVVRAKARSIINNHRYLWKIGRWRTNTKTGECSWNDPDRNHPYSAYLAEEEDLVCPTRVNKEKLEVLQKLDKFQFEDMPTHKSDCLQGDARERLGAY